jgi:hypothetical protein
LSVSSSNLLSSCHGISYQECISSWTGIRSSDRVIDGSVAICGSEDQLELGQKTEMEVNFIYRVLVGEHDLFYGGNSIKDCSEKYLD